MTGVQDNVDGTATPSIEQDLAVLRQDFPGFRIWPEEICDRTRYVARSQRPGLHPHTVITDDLDELRQALKTAGWRTASLQPRQAEHRAHLRLPLQGKDHYQPDRQAAEWVLEEFPKVAAVARANRAFIARAVRHVARQGIRQFIDAGAGLPASSNVHEMAGGARVVYADNDPMVLAHARALLAVDSQVSVVAADIRDPEAALASPGLRGPLDLGQPFCVLLASVLHFLPADEADAAVAAFRRLMIPGSYLVISAGTSTGTDPGLISRLQAAYDDTTPVTGRTAEEVSAWFEGLTLAKPGLTDVWAWRPDDPQRPREVAPSRARFLAAAAANQLARIMKAAGTIHACRASHLNSQSCSAASGTDARLVPGCGGVAGERRSRPWCGQAGCRR
jgi:O-methyltransferase involved in polyketide biosynthesis